MCQATAEIGRGSAAPDHAAGRHNSAVHARAALGDNAHLPSRHRQVFEAIGLGNEATYEFATRIGAKAPRAVSPGPPPPPPGKRRAPGGMRIPAPPRFDEREDSMETTFDDSDADGEPTHTRSKSGIIDARAS